MAIGLALMGSDDVAESMFLQEVFGHVRTKPNASASQGVRDTAHCGLRIAPHNVKYLKKYIL